MCSVLVWAENVYEDELGLRLSYGRDQSLPTARRGNITARFNRTKPVKTETLNSDRFARTMKGNAVFMLVYVFTLWMCLPVIGVRKSGIVHETITLPCNLFCNDTLTWTLLDTGPVIRCERGDCQTGKGFENRVRVSNESFHGNRTLGLIIGLLKFNDQGHYEGKCGDQYCDYTLQVLVPVDVNVSTGNNATLPCYAAMKKNKDHKTAYILWERNGEMVLLLKNGTFTYGRMLENRVSVSKNGYKNGDLSLHIVDALPSDQGVYVCQYSDTGKTDDFKGGPNSVRLNVQGETKSWFCVVLSSLVTLASTLILQAIVYCLCKGIQSYFRCPEVPRMSVPVQNDDRSSTPLRDLKDVSSVCPNFE
ncbi:uncharacterized protein LOC121712138 isoform X1 [Alosa sapidissima]|uniref:uncharacterized protein LOC121712138 isoform X1 n=2 Tax=Alosa sapidissima TaxID=34773 RepID=UPI001C0805C5|nr:uncharacterized protein LOC121712138 isoform X1 [Alosa sapidissima]